MSVTKADGTDRLKTLEELKVLGRVADHADPIYANDVLALLAFALTLVQGIKVLTKHAFKSDNASVRREAQRCLANAMFLKPETRAIFVDTGGLKYFIQAFKSSTSDKTESSDDFLLGRIGFLLTAEKSLVVERLVIDKQILEDISKVTLLNTLLLITQ